ncbi:MAG: helix-turn-helix transcriptional regulator, partial [Humidesulfovibrio sp.]|nr:helix-turn-helix transcriptional regulator [Humidesulfovibrio sp.]
EDVYGGSFDDWLKEEGLFDEVQQRSAKRIVAMELAAYMEKQHITATDMAKRLNTSRSGLRRILKAELPSITLSTIERVATAIGMTARIVLEPIQAEKSTTPHSRP